MNRLDPRLISEENQMQDFLEHEWMEEFRRKNLHVIKKCRHCYTQGCEGQCMANAFTWNGTEEIPPHREQEKPRILLADEPKAPVWFKVAFVVMYAAAIGVVIWALSNIHF